jgi:enoyl-CoA hydratase/carnithine racemase
MNGAAEPLVRRNVDAPGVVTLTLNCPQAYNALSEGMLSLLERELETLTQDDPTVRAL